MRLRNLTGPELKKAYDKFIEKNYTNSQLKNKLLELINKAYIIKSDNIIIVNIDKHLFDMTHNSNILNALKKELLIEVSKSSTILRLNKIKIDYELKILDNPFYTHIDYDDSKNYWT